MSVCWCKAFFGLSCRTNADFPATTCNADQTSRTTTRERARESGCTYSHKTTLNSDSPPKHSEMLRCLLLPPTKLSPAFSLQAKLDLHLILVCHWHPAKSMANKHKAQAFICLFIITQNNFVIASC